MSSGIQWTGWEAQAPAGEPPLRLRVGVAWASGAPDELVVQAQRLGGVVSTAYSHVPGLGGARSAWLYAPHALSARALAETAINAVLQGRSGPRVREALAFSVLTPEEVSEVLAVEGLTGDALLVDVWAPAGRALETWAQRRWGQTWIPPISGVRWTFRGEPRDPSPELLRALSVYESLDAPSERRRVDIAAAASLRASK